MFLFIKRFAWNQPLKVVVLTATFAVCGCTGVDNTRGIATHDINPAQRGPVAGIGIEGHDIIAMSDRMMRDMLQSPTLANSSTPPQVIVDAEYFVNQSSQQIDKNMITDRLRTGLNNAAHGRMIFVSRESAGMVEHERNLKRSGTVDVGTRKLTKAQAGADYRLRGRISSLDSMSGATGLKQRMTQIQFEMIDTERGTIIWSNMYTIERAASDDVIYR